MSKLGICCSCQSAHPVTTINPAQKRSLMREMSMDEDEYDYIHGGAGSHVMLPHRISEDGTGPECEGAGDIPQTLVST